MKAFFAFFAFISSLLIIEGWDTAKMTQNSEKVVLSKTIKLFNGKNLDGWYTFVRNRGRDIDPKKVFTVNKGLIRISGEEYGCITTNEEYGDYKLIVEFKWGTQTYSPGIAVFFYIPLVLTEAIRTFGCIQLNARSLKEVPVTFWWWEMRAISLP
jgi:hypothetical protein